MGVEIKYYVYVADCRENKHLSEIIKEKVNPYIWKIRDTNHTLEELHFSGSVEELSEAEEETQTHLFM